MLFELGFLSGTDLLKAPLLGTVPPAKQVVLQEQQVTVPSLVKTRRLGLGASVPWGTILYRISDLSVDTAPGIVHRTGAGYPEARSRTEARGQPTHAPRVPGRHGRAQKSGPARFGYGSGLPSF